MPRLPSYPRRLLQRAYSETAAFTKGKLLMSAIMGLLTRFALWEFSTKTKIGREIILDMLILAGCYVVVSVGALLVNLFRAPALLDAECQHKIEHLSEQLELPDKAQAEHLRALLSQLSENGKAILRYCLFSEDVNLPHMKIDGLTDQDMDNARKECLELGLLRWRCDAPDSASPGRWFYQFVWVPQEFHLPLKRLLYSLEKQAQD
jgi:hypothetical protein